MSTSFRQFNPWAFFAAAWVGFLISACQNTPKAPDAGPDVSQITRHQHWVTASFMEALRGMSDSLFTSNCMELRFSPSQGDSVLMVNCNSDAGLCAYVGKDSKTILLTSGLGEGDTVMFHLNADGSATLSGGPFEPLKFVAVPNIPDSVENPIFHMIAQKIAGNYVPVKAGGVLDMANPILLQANGNIKGMKNAATFEIPVGGDLQAYNGNIVYFNAADGNSTAMGWTLRRDTLALWNIKNTSLPDEVPWFERGTLFGQYLKQR